jgi:hypothetical protein
MRPFEKRFATGWSFSAGMIFGGLATFGLLASPGIPKSTADVSRPIADRPAVSAGAPAAARSATVIESHPGEQSTPAPVPDANAESNSASMQETDPNHPELTLQLD